MVDDRTPGLDLPLPHPSNQKLDDVDRLRDAIVGLDAAIILLNTAIASVGDQATLKAYFDTVYAAIGHSHAGLYALAAQGVTNGNSHNHTGGAGAQISYSSLSNRPTLGTLAAKNAVNNFDWSGVDLSIENGGTGASDAAGARANLGLGSASTEPATAFMRASAVADLEMNNYRLFELKTATFNSEFDAGNSGTSKTINWADGQFQKLTLTGNVAITFNWAGCGVGRYQLKLIQDATGSRTVAWSTGTPGSNRWLESAAAPAHKATANSETIVTVYYDGTNAYGSMGKVGG